MKEIWKKIKDNPNYEISNLGRLRSVYKYNVGTKEYILRDKPLIMSKTIDNGYEKIKLSCKGKKTIKYIHRLVAEAFIPNPNNYKEVNHIDSNTRNNKIDNLEWCNRQQNINHMRNHQEEILNRNEMRWEALQDIYYGIETGLYKNLDDVKNRIDDYILNEY